MYHVSTRLFYFETHGSFPLDSKGVSANMLKISSKRRRTLKQIKAEKEAKEQEEAEKAAQEESAINKLRFDHFRKS